MPEKVSLVAISYTWQWPCSWDDVFKWLFQSSPDSNDCFGFRARHLHAAHLRLEVLPAPLVKFNEMFPLCTALGTRQLTWKDLLALWQWQLSEGPMTKPIFVQNKNVCKKVMCAPWQAKPQSLQPSCSCVPGPLALVTSSHAIKVHRDINTMDFLSDQPCVTCATYSLFRGASLEKGAISDCVDCTKQDGYCQILFDDEVIAKVRVATATTSNIWCAVLLPGSWSRPQVAGTGAVFLIPPCPCILVRPCSINNRQTSGQKDKGVARWERPVYRLHLRPTWNPRLARRTIPIRRTRSELS